MKYALLALALIIALPFAYAPESAAFFSFGSKATAVKAEGGLVRVPLKDVSDGSAHFYSLSAGGKDITFFLLKSKDGSVRAAFDACDVCYHAKKGYEQEGENMVCLNCGMKFHASRVGDIKGGCNPSPLARTADDKDVIIKVEDIQAGARFF